MDRDSEKISLVSAIPLEYIGRGAVGDLILKSKTIFRLEKAFRNEMALMRREDLYIRQLPSEKFIVTVPHPEKDVEYVLNTYENRTAAREFADVGRAVNAAFRVGARSIHFELLNPPAEID